MTRPSPAPGWYPDPSDLSRQRYFDGSGWTENYAPFVAPIQPAKTGMSRGIKIALGVGAAALALLAISSIENSDNISSSPSPSSWTVTTTTAPPTTKPTSTVENNFTSAQERAIAKAESYLRYSAFSKQGLINQLVYDKFSTADATFAVERIEADGGVDWDEQAVKKAKSYLEYTSFSLAGLIDQLQYDGFTPNEAQHGARAAYEG